MTNGSCPPLLLFGNSDKSVSTERTIFFKLRAKFEEKGKINPYAMCVKWLAEKSKLTLVLEDNSGMCLNSNIKLEYIPLQFHR